MYEPLNARIVTRLDALRGGAGARAGARPAPLERGQSWQSPHGLHRLDDFKELAAIVEDAVRAVLVFQRIGYQAFRITGCWANINAPGAAHRMHSHPNNYLSGVYYAQVRAGADTINFHDPRPQTGVMRPPVTELNSANADQAVVRVADGTLLLFPSWLPHSVDPNASDEPRVSVSFNVMFSAYAESLAQPLWGEDAAGP